MTRLLSKFQRRWWRIRPPRQSIWRITGLGMMILGFILLFALVLWRGFISHAACHLPIVTKAINFEDRTWCLEFWINRYQGLIGAIATIMAGLVAFLAVQKQVLVARSVEYRQMMIELRRLAILVQRAQLSFFQFTNLSFQEMQLAASDSWQDCEQIVEKWEKIFDTAIDTNEKIYATFYRIFGSDRLNDAIAHYVSVAKECTDYGFAMRGHFSHALNDVRALSSSDPLKKSIENKLSDGERLWLAYNERAIDLNERIFEEMATVDATLNKAAPPAGN